MIAFTAWMRWADATMIYLLTPDIFDVTGFLLVVAALLIWGPTRVGSWLRRLVP